MTKDEDQGNGCELLVSVGGDVLWTKPTSLALISGFLFTGLG